MQGAYKIASKAAKAARRQADEVWKRGSKTKSYTVKAVDRVAAGKDQFMIQLGSIVMLCRKNRCPRIRQALAVNKFRITSKDRWKNVELAESVYNAAHEVRAQPPSMEPRRPENTLRKKRPQHYPKHYQ